MRLHTALHRSVSLVAAVCWLTSCATIIHGGGTQTVSINTQPAGARVSVGDQTVIAPAEVKLDRDKDYQVVASMPGYDDATATIESHFSWITVMDMVLILPWVVDLISGGSDYLEPDEVNLQLGMKLPPNPYAQPHH